MNSATPLFIRLRGAVFHENGYCFDAPSIHKGAPAYFIESRDGKAQSMTPVPGSCERSEDGMVFVHLTPYANDIEAKRLVTTMCMLLPQALDGDRAAKVALGLYWHTLLSKCVKKEGDLGNAFKRLSVMLGDVRIAMYAKSKQLAEIDLALLVDEALGIATHPDAWRDGLKAL
jgi:hypothetical protein